MDIISSTASKSLTIDTTFFSNILSIDAYSKIPNLFRVEKITTEDLFNPKTDLFSTRALISVHLKTVRYFYQPIFSLFSYLKNA